MNLQHYLMILERVLESAQLIMQLLYSYAWIHMFKYICLNNEILFNSNAFMRCVCLS